MTGHARGRRRQETLGALAIAVALALALSGCSPDIHEGVGPRVPVPDVTGEVMRGGSAADNLDVDLRTVEGAVVVQSTATDARGAYAFYEIEPGDWEIKASGDMAGDFDAVSRVVRTVAVAGIKDVPRMNIDAMGAALLEPHDSVTVATPNPFQWMTFRFVLPDAEILWARVQVYEDSGVAVWSSDRALDSEVLWNGVGNRGEHEGRIVAPGDYRWRVKFQFPDSMEARLDMRALRLE